MVEPISAPSDPESISHTSQFEALSAITEPSLVRRELHHGREHIVAPVVMLVGDSILRPLNSRGAEFVPSRVLETAASSWNGRAVVMDHPTNADGTPITANSRETNNRYAYGTVWNVRFEKGALRGELWLDPALAAHVGPDAEAVIARVLANEPVEVSVGAMVRAARTIGDGYEWQWEAASGDHLATLPQHKEGACSFNDGCGIRANSSNPTSNSTSDSNTDAPSIPSSESDNGDDRQKENCMCDTAKLAGRLIANARSPFDEKDRSMLEALGEVKLTALVSLAEDNGEPKKEQPGSPTPTPTPEPTPLPLITPSTAVDDDKKIAAAAKAALRSMSQAEFLSFFPEVAAIVDAHNTQQAALSTSLVDLIHPHANNAWSKEELAKKPVAELTALARAFNIAQPSEIDFSLVGLSTPKPAASSERRPVPNAYGIDANARPLAS